MAKTPEGNVKTKFIKDLKKRVKLTTVLQYKQDATTVKGFPDTIILGPEAVTVYIEFKKARNATFQPGQKYWGDRLKERNFLYYCVSPQNAEEVLNELEEILK